MADHVSEVFYHTNVDHDHDFEHIQKDKKSGYIEAICNIFKS